ncbi:hypothetical protein MHY49_01790 [Brachybacterium sp. ACRRE]|nr:YchJ family metal-binding protein [Brachybacterium sp. ACRRE]MCG7308236.1 hypothetical protein [Brachybacterium sp. ACRRE]
MPSPTPESDDPRDRGAGNAPAPAPAPDDSCLCGSGEVFAGCCGPILAGDRDAPTAEALMRSRFSAFALGDTAHLRRSWDAAQRPSAAELEASDDGDLRWQKLRILDVDAGGPGDAEGVVEFVAIARGSEGKVRLHERSRFRRVEEAPGWVYVDGEIRG